MKTTCILFVLLASGLSFPAFGQSSGSGSDGTGSWWWTVHDNGVLEYWYLEKDWDVYHGIFLEDGTHMEWYVGPLVSNPTPDDPDNEVSLEALIQLAIQKGGNLETVAPRFGKTPLGKLLVSKGEGIEPAHNPDPTTRSALGVDPVGPLGGLHLGGDQEEEELHLPRGFLPGFEFLPNSGTLGEQLAKHGRKRGRGSDAGSPNDLKPEDAGFWGDDLPGPPELVNPSWKRNALRGR